MEVDEMVKENQKMIKKEQDHEEDHNQGDQNDGLPVPSTTTTQNQRSAGNKSTAPPAQLTIFYAGTVRVFDGISAEKAQAIMLIAAAAASATNNTNNSIVPCAGAPSPVLIRIPSLQSTSAAVVASPPLQLNSIQNASICKLQSELPIARRHSLQRFLEKRRDRLESKSPYPPSTPIRAASDNEKSGSVEASSQLAGLLS